MTIEKTLIKTSLTALVVASAFGPVANAATDSQQNKVPNPAFASVDTNGDGYISRNEAEAHHITLQAFKEADDNHDGRLSPGEFVKAEAIDQRVSAAKYIDDSVITAKVKAELLRSSVTKGLEVHVETYKGQVQLSGFVNSDRQAHSAEKIAAGVPGVKKVINDLVVKG